MKKRLALQCWSCPKIYFQTVEITNQQQVIVTCPYCNAEAVVDLQPDRKKTRTVMRGENKDTQSEEALQLPDILPTRKPD